MKMANIKVHLLLTVAIVLGTATMGAASDGVELNVYKTLRLEATPIDMAVTADGRRIFVLTDQGEVIVYSTNGGREADIDVGKHVNRIKSVAGGDALILGSGENKTVQIITLDFIQKISTDGAPFKGPEDAPVVVAVFDDFQ